MAFEINANHKTERLWQQIEKKWRTPLSRVVKLSTLWTIIPPWRNRRDNIFGLTKQDQLIIEYGYCDEAPYLCRYWKVQCRNAFRCRILRDQADFTSVAFHVSIFEENLRAEKVSDPYHLPPGSGSWNNCLHLRKEWTPLNWRSTGLYDSQPGCYYQISIFMFSCSWLPAIQIWKPGEACYWRSSCQEKVALSHMGFSGWLQWTSAGYFTKLSVQSVSWVCVYTRLLQLWADPQPRLLNCGDIDERPTIFSASAYPSLESKSSDYSCFLITWKPGLCPQPTEKWRRWLDFHIQQSLHETG